MVQLKDVIHLYLGCKGVTQKRTVELTGINLMSELKLLWEGTESDMHGAASCAKDIYSAGFKPILRKLSDMTEEESYELEMIGHELIINKVSTNEFHAARTAYLLSHHFDLFNLIESGQAIDKETLTTKK